MKLYQTRDVVRHTLPYLKGQTLDLGAGTAKYRKIVETQVDNYVTFDQNPGEHIDKVGDILNTGFEDNSFDSIMCHQVLEHVPQPWLAVEEMWRILKPEGFCVTSVPFLLPYHADPHDYFRYTKEGLKNLFHNAHFDIVQYDSYGGLGSVLSEGVHHTFFSPYKKKKIAATQIIRLSAFIGRLLNRLVTTPEVYSSVYVLAQKKSQ